MDTQFTSHAALSALLGTPGLPKFAVLFINVTASPHAALSALPGTPGLAVAHHWLAAMLEQLASRVWPYNAVVYAGVPSPSPTASSPSGSSSNS
eukprot:scaffold235404_cov19-Tisochrysis_lutea.AAC.3